MHHHAAGVPDCLPPYRLKTVGVRFCAVAPTTRYRVHDATLLALVETPSRNRYSSALDPVHFYGHSRRDILCSDVSDDVAQGDGTPGNGNVKLRQALRRPGIRKGARIQASGSQTAITERLEADLEIDVRNDTRTVRVCKSGKPPREIN